MNTRSEASPSAAAVDGRVSGAVLIVDDHVKLASSLARLLRDKGYDASVAASARAGRARMAELQPDVVLMDLVLPDGDGGELVAELVDRHPRTRFVIITAHGSFRSALLSGRRGAVDYLTKPLLPEDVLAAVDNAMRELLLSEELRRLRETVASATVEGAEPAAPPSSRAMRKAMALAELAAQRDGLVLLLGENGTGKDRLARWIHGRSARSQGPFFSINCSAVPPALAESELFGHEPGAFTGSRARKRGLLELAQRGTLLLNEVGELEPMLQAKLLSFLDTRTIMRVGGVKPINVTARVIAATNRDLRAEVRAGRFREDLFYRLNVFPIELPPLRDRRRDIPALTQQLLTSLGSELGLPEVPEISEDAVAALLSHDWPGNVRELKNLLERALILSGGRRIEARDLSLPTDDEAFGLRVDFEPGRNLHDVTREVARRLIREALRRAPTQREAAEMLGLSRSALLYQVKALGMQSELQS